MSSADLFPCEACAIEVFQIFIAKELTPTSGEEYILKSLMRKEALQDVQTITKNWMIAITKKGEIKMGDMVRKEAHVLDLCISHIGCP